MCSLCVLCVESVWGLSRVWPLLPFSLLPLSIRLGAAGCRTPGSDAEASERAPRDFQKVRLPAAPLDVRLQKTLVFSLVFRFPDASRAGRPRPDCTSASLPPFHVREAVFMVFNVDHPPAPQPHLLFFLSFF